MGARQCLAKMHEAEGLFAGVRDDTDDLDALQRSIDWMEQSAEHREVYESAAMTWVAELVELAENALEESPGRASTLH